MKTYARLKTKYANLKGNAIVVCNFKQICEQYDWIKKGLIENKVQEYAKYIEIKKELKAKGLI